ncbi:MAG TPA: glycosyl hydrolase family 18 protein [Candidatus Nanopelagicaceae bacterium]|nr:glycosyl hydrolase family 18 protein [Candidatus Nanopelagicaceae bacterium]
MRKPSNAATALPLAVFLIVGALLSPLAHAADPPVRKIVSGWSPYWATRDSNASITANADLIDDVSPFWFSVKSSTQLLDQYTPANSIPMATQVATLHAAGVKVIPTFTDGTGKLTMAGILADPAQSAALIATLTTSALVNNFDGIDLDFEGFAFSDGSASWPTTQPNWTRFVGQLSASLHLQGKLLSVTTPELRDPATGKRGYWVYDWAGIASSIDRLRIMTYDYSVAFPGPIGPISWVEAAAKYAVSLIPASKVFIGIPAYGRDWVTSVTGTCPVRGSDGQALGVTIRAPQNGQSGSRATFVANYAQTLAASYGATPTWNATYGENTFSYVKTYVGTNASGASASCTAQRTAWYQDARGVQLRAALVGKYRLGGIAFWAFGNEDPATWAQLRAYAKTIAPDQVNGTIALSQPSVGYSSPSIITATFQIADSTPVAGVPISFQVLKDGDTTWNDIGTATTSVTGVAQIALIASQNLQVRALSPGSWQQLAATTPSQQLKVARLISVNAPPSIRQNSTLTITGSVWPTDTGVGVVLQMNSLGKWLNVASATSGDGGNFALSTTAPSPGLFAFRVAVSADSKLDGAMSRAFTELVR